MLCVEIVAQCENKQNLFPKLGSPFSAGFDICSSENVVVPSNSQSLIHTGLKMKLPAGTYGQLKSRSGLAVKKNIHVGAGVIDEDFRGEVKVLLMNHSNEDFEVHCFDRIAQLIVIPVIRPAIALSTVLDDTERGEQGFGSTGVGVH